MGIGYHLVYQPIQCIRIDWGDIEAILVAKLLSFDLHLILIPTALLVSATIFDADLLQFILIWGKIHNPLCRYYSKEIIRIIRIISSKLSALTK